MANCATAATQWLKMVVETLRWRQECCMILVGTSKRRTKSQTTMLSQVELDEREDGLEDSSFASLDVNPAGLKSS